MKESDLIFKGNVLLSAITVMWNDDVCILSFHGRCLEDKEFVTGFVGETNYKQLCIAKTLIKSAINNNCPVYICGKWDKEDILSVIVYCMTL